MQRVSIIIILVFLFMIAGAHIAYSQSPGVPDIAYGFLMCKDENSILKAYRDVIDPNSLEQPIPSYIIANCVPVRHIVNVGAPENLEALTAPVKDNVGDLIQAFKFSDFRGIKYYLIVNPHLIPEVPKKVDEGAI